MRYFILFCIAIFSLVVYLDEKEKHDCEKLGGDYVETGEVVVVSTYPSVVFVPVMECKLPDKGE